MCSSPSNSCRGLGSGRANRETDTVLPRVVALKNIEGIGESKIFAGEVVFKEGHLLFKPFEIHQTKEAVPLPLFALYNN